MLLWIVVIIIPLVIAYFLGVLNGPIYVPTPNDRVKRMLRLAALKPGETLVDIGSGDGRILIAAALVGARAVGYELNPIMVFMSRRNIRRAGVAEMASVYWGDFWQLDLSDFDVVAVYGIPHIMARLERKLAQELSPDARVVSHSFHLPTWQGAEEDRVFLYERP